MKQILTLILTVITLSSCSSFNLGDKPESKIVYKTKFTKTYKEEIEKAKKSAEEKISTRLGEEYKLLGNVYITIEKNEPGYGLQVGGANTFMPGIGSSMVINYVDENLFNKLEHEFAHAIRNSNRLPKGHVNEHDKDFYNWSFSRKHGSG